MLCFRVQAPRPSVATTAQFSYEAPVAERLAAKCAFSHAMSANERIDIGEER